MADKEFIARNGIIANTTFVANATVVQANGISVNSTGAYVTGTANAASHTVGSSFIANSTAIVGTGYANVTTSVNSALLTVGSSLIANTTGVYHTGTVNAASHTVGASFVANTTGAYHTGTVNAASHTTTGVTANATGVYPASNSSGTALGSTTNRWIMTANSLALSTALAVGDGGTGATTAANARANLGVTATGSDTTYAYRANNLSDLGSASTARTNLGLGTIATQAASSVSITGGTISGLSSLGVSGAITATGDITAFSSDIRLKENIQPIDAALNKVNKISGFTYTFTEEAVTLGIVNSASQPQVGVSAQEILTVLPEAVKPSPASNKYLTVQYEKIVPLLIEAIKELSVEIDQLKSSQRS